jgi:hypothetical protein
MAPPVPLKASSGTKGFFQPHPKLENQLHEDAVLSRIFNCKDIRLKKLVEASANE